MLSLFCEQQHSSLYPHAVLRISLVYDIHTQVLNMFEMWGFARRMSCLRDWLSRFISALARVLKHSAAKLCDLEPDEFGALKSRNSFWVRAAVARTLSSDRWRTTGRRPHCCGTNEFYPLYQRYTNFVGTASRNRICRPIHSTAIYSVMNRAGLTAEPLWKAQKCLIYFIK